MFVDAMPTQFVSFDCGFYKLHCVLSTADEFVFELVREAHHGRNIVGTKLIQI